ncbi:MAG: SRPBCC family protein [Chloroflexota bacterium]
MTERAHREHLGPISAEVDAPAALTFQMLAAIGQGAPQPGEEARVLSRDGDSLVCEFVTSVPLPLGWTRQVRTTEAVRIVPPDRIEFEHLDGPVRGLRETIVVEPIGSRRSRIVYRGTYPASGGIAGHAVRLLSRGAIKRAVEQHLDDLRGRAEQRAARSRLFASPPGAIRASPDPMGGVD